MECKHEWKKSHIKINRGGNFVACIPSVRIECDVFVCVKCGKTIEPDI